MDTAPETTFTTLDFLMHQPNKLKCCITSGWKDFPGTNTLAYSPIGISVSYEEKYIYGYSPRDHIHNPSFSHASTQ